MAVRLDHGRHFVDQGQLLRGRDRLDRQPLLHRGADAGAQGASMVASSR
jgi:hypothetical protein